MMINTTVLLPSLKFVYTEILYDCIIIREYRLKKKLKNMLFRAISFTL